MCVLCVCVHKCVLWGEGRAANCMCNLRATDYLLVRRARPSPQAAALAAPDPGSAVAGGRDPPRGPGRPMFVKAVECVSLKERENV